MSQDELVPCLLAAEESGIQIVLNTSADSQVQPATFTVTSSGKDRRIERIRFGSYGVDLSQSPIFHWQLFRTYAKSDRGQDEDDVWRPGGWAPSGFSELEVETEEPAQSGPFYAEDLKTMDLLRENEIITVQLILRTRGVWDLFQALGDACNRITTSLFIDIEGEAAIPCPIHIDRPIWDPNRPQFLALDYGNQDFMLAHMDGSTPKLITPSMFEQAAGKDADAFDRFLLPESSKTVILETFDPHDPYFVFGNAVHQARIHQDLSNEPIWEDTAFSGSRLESLKPFLTCSEGSVVKNLSLWGQMPCPSNVYIQTQEGLETLIRRYFQKMVGAIDWHMSSHWTQQFKIHSPIIITHPVGVDREFRSRIKRCFVHETPRLFFDRKIEFINEAMAALGTIWAEHIHENIEATATRLKRSGQPMPQFRNLVRISRDLPMVDALEDGRLNNVLILQADVGHGTTDLCISAITHRENQLVFDQAFPYAIHLGGRDLTKAIYRYCVNWLMGKTDKEAPSVPAQILNVITGTESTLGANGHAMHFWRFLQVAENLKKKFADRETEFENCTDLIRACKDIADKLGIAYTPEEGDENFAIHIDDVEDVMRPIVQEIARTLGALKRAFEAKHKTKIDFFAFVGQSMLLKLLREEIVLELADHDQSLIPMIEKGCIFLDNPTELKGAVAKGALYLLGPQLANFRPVNYDRLVHLPYGVYVGDYTKRVIPADTKIDIPFDASGQKIFKTAKKSYALREISEARIPSSFDIKIRYEAIQILDPHTSRAKHLGRSIGRVYFPKDLQGKPLTGSERICFEYTSDEYLIPTLEIQGQTQPLVFEKISAIFQESMHYYNDRRISQNHD